MMAGSSAHRLMARLAIWAAVAITATVLIVLGLAYQRQNIPPQSIVQEPAATNPLELSVFDEPREVPEIRFQDEEGHDLTLADFRGRMVLLDMWATWCVPCHCPMLRWSAEPLAVAHAGSALP